MTIIEATIRMSNEQDEIARAKCKLVKEINAFVLNGDIFEGKGSDAAILFAYNNPDGGDFHAWCQDNYKIIGRHK